MLQKLLEPLSLKTRFLAGTLAMLIPMVILAVGAFLALDHATEQMEEVVEEALEEDMPIVHLQKEIQRANMEGHDLLMNSSLMAREEFKAADREVRRDFEGLLANAPFQMDEEHRYLEKAFSVWKIHSEELLDFATQTGDNGTREGRVAYDVMQRFDAGMEQSLFHLDRVRSVAREEIDQRATLAYKAKASMLAVVVAVFLLGFFIAAAGAVLIGRSVLLPVYDIAAGIARMSSGDFSHRVLAATNDELGELARSFNRLGERLKQSECALNDSMRDSLTGLYSAREFNTLLSLEIQRSLRYHRAFSVVVFDIDGFANFNASFGREAGDRGLQSIAESILGEVREVDRVARYGHDEFAILLTEVKLDGARATAERVLRAVQALTFEVPGNQTRSLTLSAGVVEYGREYPTEDGLSLGVEKAVREARLNGGNQIVCA